jgi:hypoxanthine phosphoribosyltransferase
MMTPANGDPPEKPCFCRDQVERILLCGDQIAGRVAELGAEISDDYAGTSLVVLGVLRGACVFLSDLLRHLDLPCQLDFVEMASYGDSTAASGTITLTKPPALPLAGKPVLVVEDIVDTGRTLAWLVEWLGQQGASVRVCCLLDKASRREVPVQIDYIGFEIPDHFVVGYGLDFAQHYRNLPHVAVLKPEVYERGATAE